MLTEIYIEALLVVEEMADQIWEAWDIGEIDDQVAAFIGFNLRIGSHDKKANPDTLILRGVSTMLRETSYEEVTDRSRGRPIDGLQRSCHEIT